MREPALPFGPQSLLWRYFGDNRMYLIGPRPAVLPRARDLLGLPWSERQERRYQCFAAFWRSRPVNWVWDRLPMRLRYNGYALKGYARA